MFSRRYSQDGKASLVQHFIEKGGNCATSPIVRARTGMSTLPIPTLFTVLAYLGSSTKSPTTILRTGDESITRERDPDPSAFSLHLSPVHLCMYKEEANTCILLKRLVPFALELRHA